MSFHKNREVEHCLFDSATSEDEETGSATKKIRSQPPDVLVTVGSGESAQTFPCYKVILSFASDYLDAMLSSDMKERATSTIKFPDKNPDEWKVFYDFITPETIGKLEHDAKSKIDDSNVLMLVPWFHEFQMLPHVRECDLRLGKKWKRWNCRGAWGMPTSFWQKAEREGESDTDYQARILERGRLFDEALGMLKLAETYPLKSTIVSIGEGMSDLMELSFLTDDLFDLEVVKSLLQLILPVELEEVGLRKTNEDECQSLCLWRSFQKIISPHAPTLSQDVVDHHESFALLVYAFWQNKIDEEKAKSALELAKAEAATAEKASLDLKEVAKRVMRRVHMYPEDLFGALPGKRNMKDIGGDKQKIDSFGRECLKRIMRSDYYRHEDDFNELGIDSLPSFYED